MISVRLLLALSIEANYSYFKIKDSYHGKIGICTKDDNLGDKKKLLSSLFCLIQLFTFACNRDTKMFQYMYILCANGFADFEVGRFVPSIRSS